MNQTLNDLGGLIGEYETFVHDAKNGKSGLDDDVWNRLQSLLSEQGDWSAAAASHLVRLVTMYGSFMLRNAAALSIAAGIEDGNAGF